MSGERVAELALLAYPAASTRRTRRRDARDVSGRRAPARGGNSCASSPTSSAWACAPADHDGERRRARIVADGLCLAAVWVMTLDISTLLSQRARGMGDPLLSSPSLALLAAVLATALVGYDRLAGAGALVGRRCAFRRCGTTTRGSSTSRPRSSPSSASAC